jgi:hypothetical protein
MAAVLVLAGMTVPRGRAERANVMRNENRILVGAA